jgi:WD40 repeat protein
VFSSNTGSGLLDFALFSTAKGQQLVAAGRDGIIRLWDMRTSGQPKKTGVNARAGSVNAVVVSSEGDLVYSGTDKGIFVWDARNMDTPVKNILQCHANSIVINPRNESQLAYQMAQTYSAGMIQILDGKDINFWESPLTTNEDHYWPTRVSMGTDGSLCCGALDNGLFITDFSKPQDVDSEQNAIQTKTNVPSPVICAQHHPLTDYIIAGLENNSIVVTGVS